LPTAGTLLSLECIAELHHTSSSLWLSLALRRGRGAPLPSGAVMAQGHTHEGWRCSLHRATITSPSRPRGRLGQRTCGLDRLGSVICWSQAQFPYCRFQG
jgi:hypothetical protein